MKEGEELCDNYGTSWGGGGGELQGLRERRKALASEFGFTCCCIACAAEEKDKVQRFKEAAKRNLIQDKKVEDGEILTLLKQSTNPRANKKKKKAAEKAVTEETKDVEDAPMLVES